MDLKLFYFHVTICNMSESFGAYCPLKCHSHLKKPVALGTDTGSFEYI